jgi:hypothetical protein
VKLKEQKTTNDNKNPKALEQNVHVALTLVTILAGVGIKYHDVFGVFSVRSSGEYGKCGIGLPLSNIPLPDGRTGTAWEPSKPEKNNVPPHYLPPLSLLSSLSILLYNRI